MYSTLKLIIMRWLCELHLATCILFWYNGRGIVELHVTTHNMNTLYLYGAFYLQPKARTQRNLECLP
jgi:hypothetical protein